MTGKLKIELETAEDVLNFTLDVVIPMLRQMPGVADPYRVDSSKGRHLCFTYWNEKVLKKDLDPSYDCGTFYCLGGAFTALTGQDWFRVTEAFYELSEVPSLSIISGEHDFSNDPDPHVELEARAQAIAEVLGRSPNGG